MNSRRGFFNTLAGIVVGGAGAAVLGPNLKLQNKPVSVIQAVNEGIRKDWDGKVGGGNRITLAHLHTALQEGTVGGVGPDMIFLSARSYARIQEHMVYDRWYTKQGPYTGLAFGGAILSKDPNPDQQWHGWFGGPVADDEILVLNRKVKGLPQHRRFRILDTGQMIVVPLDVWTWEDLRVHNPRMNARIYGIGA